MLTEAVREDLRRAALGWIVTADLRGRLMAAPRDAWAALEGAVAMAGGLSPGAARDLAVNPWTVAGFLDPTGRRGWRVEGPARVLGPGEDGHAAAREALEAEGFGPSRRLLWLAVARVDPLDLAEDGLLPAQRAARGLALLSARESREEG
jgi:hypothetical protein